MNKVYFERVWFELYGFLNGRNWFFKLSRKPIFPKNDVTGALTLPQTMRCCLPDSI